MLAAGLQLFSGSVRRTCVEERLFIGCTVADTIADAKCVRESGVHVRTGWKRRTGQISERRRAERALHEGEVGYRALLRGIPDVVMRFDGDGRHLFASENVNLITELEASDFIGKTHLELGFAPELCKVWETAIASVFRERKPVESEFEFDGRGGQAVYDWRLIPEFDMQGVVVSVLSICRNITRQRRAEADYQLLFQEMPDGVALHEIICDENNQPIDYRFLAVNPAFERLTGLQATSLLGRTVLAVMPGIEHHWIETYGKVALTGDPVSFESLSVDLGKHFQVTAFSPAPRQFVSIFSDITDRKRAEEERANLEAQLQQAQKLESIGRLAGGIAHDFNNMLGVILGSLELAMAQTKPHDTIHADLLEARRAAERSADLTRQLLAFARQQPVVLKTTDLNETIESMLNMVRRLIGEGITLTWQPAAALWNIRMDPSQFHQVLVNLCVNARDAITGVGFVTITTGNVSIGVGHPSHYGTPAPGDYVLTKVSDSGSGIPAETLEHIFEPFFTTKRVGEGTGLGLALVHGVTSQNGGFVEVSSESGKGTTFSIYLPRYSGDNTTVQVTESAADLVGGHAKVLLLEDEPVMLQVIKRMLEVNGYAVMATRTPHEAIAMATEHQGAIDLLLTDVVMPEMDGRELARRVLVLNPRVGVLYMSGYTANVIGSHGVLDDGVHFIEKPFKGRELIAKVRAALAPSTC